MQNKIIIRKANQHNLKNIDLELPKNQLIVFTGVSGSGKSSLAFDTIFAEGQRRYVESLSSYARQFLGRLDKPDVESIEGLSPAIAIDQKSTSHNPRSTVGTVTEIYDHLRLLYARIGHPHCPQCKSDIRPQSIDQIINTVLAFPENSKIEVLSPVVTNRKGEYDKLLEGFRKDGFLRVKIDGTSYNLDEKIELHKNKKHTISLLVDRLVMKNGIKSRLADSLSIALEKSGGVVAVNVLDDQEYFYSEHLHCINCQLSFDELTPQMFSFNSPYGACEECNGLGLHEEIDEDLIIPDPAKSLMEGAIFPWAKTGNPYYTDILTALAETYGFSMDEPFRNLSKENKEMILYGMNRSKLRVETKDWRSKYKRTFLMKYEGVIPGIKRRYDGTQSDLIRDEYGKYMRKIPCKACLGKRLKPHALAVTIVDKSIDELCDMSIGVLHKFFTILEENLSEFHQSIAHQLIGEIKERIKFLLNLGLDYLNLSRSSGTLSGGEAQRIRLATQIGAGLSGVLYVLDEPSIGLHQYNNNQLIRTLERLRDLGNTLIVVEHDEDTIRTADWIIDIGPKAGVHGGEIVSQGTIQDIEANIESLTGQYLSGKRTIALPKKARKGNGQYLEVKGAHLNNLNNIDVTIPLGKFVTITGVSGSGKSTLIFDLLYPSLKSAVYKNKPAPKGVNAVKGIEYLDKVIDIDQSPIGRTPRSNPATYTGVFDHIRELFSKTKEAKIRGYKQGRFSFNVKGGRCESCSGDGIITIEMNFLPNIYVPCEVCKGKRYNSETLEIRYKGATIDDILNMTVEEALNHFHDIPRIHNKLTTLMEVGLDYVRLGQIAPTLSGGEAQRIKLASELNKRSTGKTIYLLDEPTIGLHWYDLEKLIGILNKLVDNGNTVVIIEHNLDIIKVSDWIIDLGPGGGDLGGNIVAEGTPQDVAKVENSFTGQYLKRIFYSEDNSLICP